MQATTQAHMKKDVMRWRMDEEIGGTISQRISTNPFDKVDSQVIYDDDEVIGARKTQNKINSRREQSRREKKNFNLASNQRIYAHAA